MPFLPNIPQATDILSNSQSDILNNFTILGAIAGNANPGSTTINSTAGFNSINLASQGGTIPVFNGNNGLWSGTYAITTKQEVWLNYQNGKLYPTTASILSNTVLPGNQSNGWTYLPSGLLFKWGRNTGSGSVTTVFPVTDAGGFSIPAFSRVFNVQVSPLFASGGDPDASVTLQTAIPTQITTWNGARISSTAKGVAFFWYAVGIE